VAVDEPENEPSAEVLGQKLGQAEPIEAALAEAVALAARAAQWTTV